MIVVPFFSLVPAVILAHTLVGPIGLAIGDAIAKVVYGGLTSTFSVIFATIFGALYAPIVMTGLHHMTNAIDMTLISLMAVSSILMGHMSMNISKNSIRIVSV